MTAQTQTVLKSYFETGDKPTQAQFGDLIDSLYVPNGSTAPSTVGFYVPSVDAGVTNPTETSGRILGVSVNGVKQVQFEDALWAGSQGSSLGFWRMGGGNSFGGVEAHAVLKAVSTSLSHCTIRMESQGEFGMIHFVHRKFVNMTVGSAGSNTDTDNQLNTYILLQGNIPGSDAIISSQRTSASISNAHGLTLYTSGTGNITFYTDNLSVTAFQMVRTASGVNYVTTTPGATGTGATLAATGSDSNVDMRLATKGSGAIRCNIGGTLNTMVTGTSTAVNYLLLSGAATGSSPSISSQGSDAGKGLVIYTAGTGNLTFYTNNLNNLILTMANNGNVTVGSAALATDATAGFLWIPSCPGTATGSATAPYTNAAALVYNSSSNTIMVRCGGTWRSTGALT